jgi:3-methyladenine DNA glycosylase Tag
MPQLKKTISPLNHSVVIVEDKNVFLTSVYWRINVNFDMSAYVEATTTLRDDLYRVEEIPRHTAPIGELRNEGAALNSLENKLGDLKKFLPRVDRRRGLINAVGSILKVLFGTVAVMDIDDIHTTTDVMQRNDTIVHSMNQQETYLKQLDGS